MFVAATDVLTLEYLFRQVSGSRVAIDGSAAVAGPLGSAAPAETFVSLQGLSMRAPVSGISASHGIFQSEGGGITLCEGL